MVQILAFIIGTMWRQSIFSSLFVPLLVGGMEIYMSGHYFLLNPLGGGKTIVDLVYPVGSIYISVISTSPASLFGGAWEQLKDKFLLAAGNAYAAGATGGEATHKLTASEMPSHNHVYSNATGVQGHKLSVNEMPSHTHYSIHGDYPHFAMHVTKTGSGNDAILPQSGDTNGEWMKYPDKVGYMGGSGSHSHGLSKANANTNSIGRDAAHNNMPPYVAVYVWKRVS